MNHNIFFQTLFILLSLLLTACGDNNSNIGDLKNKLLSIKQQEKLQQKMNPLADLKMPAVIEYDSHTQSKTLLKANLSNPLENFPISAIQFIGTLKKDNQIFAYVMIPNNVVYTVKIGDIVGDEKGKISNITENRLEISKSKEEPGQTKSQETVILKLKE